MSSEFERSGRVQISYDLMKNIKKIIREIQRTFDTDGCYNPYNKSANWLYKTLDECNNLLRKRLE